MISSLWKGKDTINTLQIIIFFPSIIVYGTVLEP